MKRVDALLVVSGAPGTGKSRAAAWLGANRPHDAGWLAFDIDSLLPAASALARRDIRQDASTWPAYGALWFDVLGSIAGNGLVPVLLTPNTPSDFDAFGMPEWCQDVHWIRLECAAEPLRVRLASRNWSPNEIAAALADASEIREQVPGAIRTDELSQSQVGVALTEWINKTGREID